MHMAAWLPHARTSEELCSSQRTSLVLLGLVSSQSTFFGVLFYMMHNILLNIFQDDELCKNRVIIEIKLHQQSLKNKKIKK